MKYCLIGEKLSHSYSEEIHNFCGLDYSLKELNKNEISLFCKNNLFDGFNITIPYKKSIIPYLDSIDESAKEIGSINTVKSINGLLYGYNTDIFGIEETFKKFKILVKNKVVIILGTGGASETAQFYCKKNNAKSINVVSRTGKLNYNNVYEKCPNAEILINATPVGMFPYSNNMPIELNKFENLEFVFDFIYNPFKTLLLQNAEKLKIKNCNGLRMLVCQALQSEKIWKGVNFSKNYENNVIKYLLFNKTNLILCGMPGCGKSTIGKIIAKMLKRDFLDTDELIYSKTNRKPEEIIIESGEEYFRNIEKEVIQSLSNEKGKIISLGGGAILKEENIENLKKNGIIIYLKRDLNLLSLSNRPISKNKGIEKIFCERNYIYSKISDFEVENNLSKEICAKGVIKAYENTCDKWSKH